jgi:hypothetical protein
VIIYQQNEKLVGYNKKKSLFFLLSVQASPVLWEKTEIEGRERGGRKRQAGGNQEREIDD